MASTQEIVDKTNQANAILAAGNYPNNQMQVSEEFVQNNPGFTPQQLANQTVVGYWSNQSEPYSRVMSAINNGTAKFAHRTAGDVDASYDELVLTTDPNNPAWNNSLVLKPTDQPNVYSFSAYNQVAAGNISGVLVGNPETGFVAPVLNAASQFAYTRGSPGGVIRNMVGDIKSAASSLGPLGTIALAFATQGLSAELGAALGLEGAAATIAGNTILQTTLNGGDVGKALTNSLVSYAGASAGGLAAQFASGGELGEFLQKNPQYAATIANTATRAALTPGMSMEDAVKAATVSVGTDAALSKIENFNKLDDQTKNIIRNTVSAELMGKDVNLPNLLTNAALSGVASYALGQNEDFQKLDPKLKSLLVTELSAGLQNKPLDQAAIKWAMNQGAQAINKAIKEDQAIKSDQSTIDKILDTKATDQKTAEVDAGTQQLIDAIAGTQKQNLQDELQKANLTDEERNAVNGVIQKIYSESSTAQALPKTITDVNGNTISRVTANPFAANDPRFVSAIAKNPSLLPMLSEYSNTYGFRSEAGNASFLQDLLETYKNAPKGGEFANDLREAIKQVVDQTPNLETDEIKNIVNPQLSELARQDLESQKVVNVNAPNFGYEEALAQSNKQAQDLGFPDFVTQQQYGGNIDQYRADKASEDALSKLSPIERAYLESKDQQEGGIAFPDFETYKLYNGDLQSYQKDLADQKNHQDIMDTFHAVLGRDPTPEEYVKFAGQNAIDVTKSLLPETAPTPTPTTEPVPIAFPGIAPAAPPEPIPETFPAPAPNPSPVTEPVPNPAPSSEPNPAPSPSAEPTPSPEPISAPNPAPVSISEPAPVLGPGPLPVISPEVTIAPVEKPSIPVSGYSGYSGISGDSGVSGYSGVSGVSGVSGFSGVSGISGISGVSGVSGISGYSGISGRQAIDTSALSIGSTGTNTATTAAATPLQHQFFVSKDAPHQFVSPLAAVLALSRMAGSEDNQAPQGESKMQTPHYSYGDVSSIDEILGMPDYFSALGGGSGSEVPQEEQAATGGLMSSPLMAAAGGMAGTRYGQYAAGGLPGNVVHHSGKARVDFRHGDAVTGAGDGQSDDIPAMLADGEFVFPADVVAAIGNGSTKAGSDKLYDMMHGIRAHVRSAKPKDLPPEIKSPLDFLGKKHRKA